MLARYPHLQRQLLQHFRGQPSIEVVEYVKVSLLRTYNVMYKMVACNYAVLMHNSIDPVTSYSHLKSQQGNVL